MATLLGQAELDSSSGSGHQPAGLSSGLYQPAGQSQLATQRNDTSADQAQSTAGVDKENVSVNQAVHEQQGTAKKGRAGQHHHGVQAPEAPWLATALVTAAQAAQVRALQQGLCHYSAHVSLLCSCVMHCPCVTALLMCHCIAHVSLHCSCVISLPMCHCIAHVSL